MSPGPSLAQGLTEQELAGRRIYPVRMHVLLASGASVDPEDDTPEELRKYADRWGTGPGWVYLTGKKANVDLVVYKLGQYTADFEDHSMLFLLGDVRNARWKKVRGDSPPALVAEMLGDLLRQR